MFIKFDKIFSDRLIDKFKNNYYMTIFVSYMEREIKQFDWSLSVCC